MNTKAALFVFVGSCFVISGCLLDSVNTVQKGSSEKVVLHVYGLPDVISEQSGDLIRGYPAGFIPKYKWAKDSEKRYYYLKRQTVISIQRSRVISIDVMSEEDKERALCLIEMIEEGKGIQGRMGEN